MKTGSIDSLRIAELVSKKNVLKLTLIALSYFLAHQIAFLFPDTAQVVMAIWPAGGIGLAALLLTPKRLWPVILTVLFLSGLAADLLANRGLFLSAGFMTANVLESLACAWLICRWCGEKICFDKIQQVLVLILAATVLNAGTACLGAGTAVLNSPDKSFWEFWRTWWVADGLGILIIAPLLVTWAVSLPVFPEKKCWGRTVEMMVFMLFWSGFSFVFFVHFDWIAPLAVRPYMLIPLMVWLGLRFDQRAVMTAAVILASVIFLGHSFRTDSFLWVTDNLTERLLMAQVFLGVVAGTGMLFSAIFSERKRAEEDLNRINHELEKLISERTAELVHVSRVAVLGQITAAFAHELNQPLGAILNSASTLGMNLSQKQPDLEEAQQDLSDIVEADKRAAAVIAKIRGLSKKDELRFQTLEVNLLVRQTVELFKKDPLFRPVEFFWDLKNNLPVISGDQVQLQQVLINLIVNALEAMSHSPRRQLTVRSAVAGPSSVVVSIADTGCGIDESRAEEYFRPFYTTKKEGLGMGLFVSKLIVQGHGGELRAENIPGAGAVFTVCLPVGRG